MNRWLRTGRAAAGVLAIALALMPATGAIAQDEVAEREQVEQELERTRAEIRRLSERLGELSAQLVEAPLRHMVTKRIVKSDRAMIGATIQSDTDSRGVKVLAVTPDGPADKAGLRAGDIIVGVDGLGLTGGDGMSASRLTDHLATLDVGEAVTVEIERDGQTLTRTLTTEALGDAHSGFAFAFDDEDFEMSLGDGGLPLMLGGGGFDFLLRGGPWADMELVELTPRLGDYFGVAEGLLVVRAPKDDSLALMDGDVIVKFAGRAVGDRRDLLRALAERRAGESVDFQIVRQRESMSLTARVPEAKAGERRLRFAAPQIFIERHTDETED